MNTFESIQEASIKLDIDKNRIKNSINQRSLLEDCYFLSANQNIFEVIEWRKNKKGGKVKVYQYTLEGDYNTEFESLAEAAKSLGLKSKSGISAAIKNHNKSSGGYR